MGLQLTGLADQPGLPPTAHPIMTVLVDLTQWVSAFDEHGSIVCGDPTLAASVPVMSLWC